MTVLPTWAEQTAPAVEVAFIDPERFTDAAPGAWSASDKERAGALAQLRQHFIALGARHLAAGERLSIEVLDVDLAGHFEPGRSAVHDIRILRGVTWPRLHLRWRHSRDGSVVAEGEERLAELNYQLHAPTCRYDASVCYEKRMLSEWFVRRFATAAVVRAR